MSRIEVDIKTIQLVSKFTELGVRYFERRYKRKVDLADAGVIDSVDEALREFEKLDIPEAYEVPDEQPMFTKHELEEGEDVIAADDEPEGNPV